MTIQQLFETAVAKSASDLHLVVGRPPMLRVDGQLLEIEGIPELAGKTAKELITSLLDDHQQKVFQEERELDISYQLPDKHRFRINLHWERGNMGLVARMIPLQPPTMEEISMPEVIYDLLSAHQGLILMTGPTGCGKSTSLAAMLDHINTNRTANIITLEDPIEFIYESKKSIIKQRQLGSDMRSFAQALKHVLRQDPNVILVGEMRDLETIAATITLAETGHLVLATLHTFSAAQTVDRIIDVFPPYQQNQVRLQLSFFLRGILSQQLIPKIGGGRVAVREILVNTPAVANMIRENKLAQIRTAIQTSAEVGMRTMDQDILELFQNGLLEKEVAVSYMTNPQELDE